MFSAIAPRYDLLNHLLSLNIDRRWRRRAVNELVSGTPPGSRFLDACAGTFDLALELASRDGLDGEIIASDFALPMLVAGKGKIENRAVTAVCGDAQRLPFPADAFAGISVGFGVRNLTDLDEGLREFHRVLIPGGKLVVLEFTLPPNRLLRPLYLLYFTRILPRIGGLISGHPWAYEYLPESVRSFPGPDALADHLRRAGFSDVRYQLLTGGIAAIHTGIC